MSLINYVSSFLYNLLTSSNDSNINSLEGIYTSYLPKELNFPYLFIEYKNIKNCDDYGKNVYDIELNINIYDNQNSNSFILEIVDTIENLINSINDSNIIDAKVLKIEHNFNNDLVPFFSSIINVKLIIEYNDD